MKTSLVFLALFVLQGVASLSNLKQEAGSKSWAGTSCYFLQGLSAGDQQDYLKLLASYGAKAIRLWVSDQPGGNRCVKGSLSVSGVPELETTIGKYNNATLDLLDQTLVYVRDAGLKAIISPHDGNKLHGPNGNDIYGQTYGAANFYEKEAAFNAFDARLRFILNYKGKHSGTVWKEWSDVILAFDIQNEPFSSPGAKCTNAPEQAWVCGRAKTMRSALGSSPIKIATGGLGGDISHGCTFLDGAVTCPELDIISVHRYAGPESSNRNQWTNSYKSWLSQAKGKLVQLEEWGVDTSKYSAKTEFPANTEDMNTGGLPWTYWQILPAQKCQTSDSDHFGIFINSGVDFAKELQGASNANSPQDWSKVV